MYFPIHSILLHLRSTVTRVRLIFLPRHLTSTLQVPIGREYYDSSVCPVTQQPKTL
jgi:hypothetical protein